MSRIGRYIRDYLLAFIIFFLLLALTLLAFIEFREAAKERREALFQLRTEQASAEINARIKDYIQILKGFKGLMYVKDTVTREDWKEYVQNLNVDENYPGIQGLGFAKFIRRPEGVENLKEQIQEEGFEDFSVSPSGKRENYTPIIFLEPFDWRNRRAFGFDMFSEPTRRQAMVLARDIGEPVLSSKVILVQETGKNIQAGFLLYVPVYDDSLDPDSLQERRNKIKGFVYSPFRAADMFSAVYQDEYPDIDVEIYSDELLEDYLLYNKDFGIGEIPEESLLLETDTIRIAERDLILRFSANPNFGAYSDRLQPYIILVGGATISVLFFFIFWALANTRRANQVLKTVTSNATPGLFMVNNSGICTYVNPAALNMMGYTFQELVKEPIYNIVYKSKLTGNQVNAGKKVIREAVINKIEYRGIEDILMKKNGTEFNASIATKPVFENGVPVSIVIEVRDITEEKKGAEKIQSINKDLSKKNEELLKINSDLDNFVYTASHDLKAPVSNIEGLVASIEEDIIENDLNPEVKTVLGLINMSISRFKETIQDLTDISKVQKNLEEKVEKIIVSEVLNEVKETIAKLIKESEATIHEEIIENEIYFSKINFKSIMYNLISNAIKYKSPERKPVIFIKAWKENKGIGVLVKDNGLGIREDKVDKIFAMFKRLHSHVEGTGIGLYIVKRIVDNAGGRINVESVEGEGTTFTLYIPTQDPEEQP